MNDKGKGIIEVSSSNINDSNHNHEGVASYQSKLESLTVDEVKAMVFETWKDAESFYKNYCKQMGFSFHKRDS